MLQSIDKYQSTTSPFMVVMTMLIAVGTFLALDMYLPSLPAIAAAFHVIPTSHTQLSISTFLFTFSLSQLLYGPASDYWGRKPILLLGFSVFVMGSVICVFAISMEQLLIGRAIQGLGIGAGALLARVILRDCFNGLALAKALSYAAIGVTSTTALAPVLGGLIQDALGFRYNFAAMLLYGLAIIGIAYTLLPETNAFRKSQPFKTRAILKNYQQVLLHPTFLTNMICNGMSFSVVITYAALNPFLMQMKLGISPSSYGLLSLLVTTGFILGAIVNNRCVSRVGIFHMTLTGSILLLASGIVSILTYYWNGLSLSGLVISCMLATFALTMIFPNTLAGAVSHFGHITGTAAALFGCLQMAVTTVVSIAVAGIPHATQFTEGLIFMGVGVSIMGVVLSLKRYMFACPVPAQQR